MRPVTGASSLYEAAKALGLGEFVKEGFGGKPADAEPDADAYTRESLPLGDNESVLALLEALRDEIWPTDDDDPDPERPSLTAHIADKDNPHEVTAAQTGVGGLARAGDGSDDSGSDALRPASDAAWTPDTLPLGTRQKAMVEALAGSGLPERLGPRDAPGATPPPPRADMANPESAGNRSNFNLAVEFGAYVSTDLSLWRPDAITDGTPPASPDEPWVVLVLPQSSVSVSQIGYRKISLGVSAGQFETRARQYAGSAWSEWKALGTIEPAANIYTTVTPDTEQAGDRTYGAPVAVAGSVVQNARVRDAWVALGSAARRHIYTNGDNGALVEPNNNIGQDGDLWINFVEN
jgi:hypothetical protein